VGVHIPLAIEGIRALLAEEADMEVTAIKALRPHLIFLEAQMPVFDGFEVIEELEPEEVPVVIFVTAYGEKTKPCRNLMQRERFASQAAGVPYRAWLAVGDAGCCRISLQIRRKK
jgi:CheY-like chemotaxis protein